MFSKFGKFGYCALIAGVVATTTANADDVIYYIGPDSLSHVPVTASTPLPVTGGGGTAHAANPTYTEGATGQPLSLDLSGNLRTIGALPSGASTSANQTTGNTSLGTIATNTTAEATGIGVPSTSTACANSSSTCDLIALGKAQLAAQQSTSPVAVGGSTANNATIGGNPLPDGCLAVNAEPTLAANGQGAYVACDLAHKQIVAPYANPENLVQGTTSAMTGTTSTSLIAAPGSGLHNYITTLSCVNSHATVGTFITVQDGSGGTAILTVAAGSVFGGTVITFPAPLRQPTANTALFVADVTTGANVICSASGYKGQ